MTDYVPRSQYQLDDDPAFAGVNCNLDAAGCLVSKDTMGLIVPDPDALRRVLLPDRDGTTMDQVLWALDRVYGWEPELVGYYPPDMFHTSLERKRGALVHVVRAPLGDLCKQGFNGTHAIYVQQPRGLDVRLYDPLCRTSRWVPWADFLAAALAFGALADHPGKIRAALTRADRVAPWVRVAPLAREKSAPYVAYTVEKGAITATKVQHTKGFTAACTRPATYRWTKVRNQQLVMITEGGYDGMYVAPDGYRVRYPGEF